MDLSDSENLPLGLAHNAVRVEFLCGNEQAFRQFKTDIEASFEERGAEIRRHQQDVIDRAAEDGLRC
jgi:hypothetical protein